jgi:monoamine oxidase
MIRRAETDWVPATQALENIATADAALRGRKLQVVILGAGMAGLAAGYELAKRGHRVTIYEGSDRVGGRVSTRRWGSGAYAERGAMRIPDVHDYTEHYTREVGLLGQRLEFSNANLGFDVHGRVTAEPILDLNALTPQEQAWAREGGVGGILNGYMKPVFDALARDPGMRRALLAGDFRAPQLKAWDEQSWESHLRSRGPSQHALDLMERVLSLAVVWHWSFAAVLRDELHQLDYKKLWSIDGGMDRLPSELAIAATRAGVQLRAGHRVEKITLAASGAGTVRFAGGLVVPFQRLLCTLPLPVMRRNAILDDGFPAAKRAAVDAYQYSVSNKVLFHYQSAWWGSTAGRGVSDQEIDGGFADPARAAVRQAYFLSRRPYVPSSVPTELAGAAGGEPETGLFRLYTGDAPSAAPSPGDDAQTQEAVAAPGVLLAAYTHEGGASSYPEDNAAAADRVLALFQRLNPAAPRPDEMDVVRWERSPWALASFAITRPGLLSRHYATLKERSGNVYFAGEYVSIAPGWIQGALESSLREVHRMLVDARSSAAEDGGADVGTQGPPDAGAAMDWTGLVRQYVDLALPLMFIRAPRGVLACGYFDVKAFDLPGGPMAGVVVRGVRTFEDMLSAVVREGDISELARRAPLSIAPGMTGRAVLERLRAG